MENILSNPGLIHIREQIFGHFDQKTLEICREVFANRFGEDWDSWLERIILIQHISEFGDTKIRRRRTFKDLIPGWNKAIKKFVKMASLKDLDEVKGSLKGLSNRANRYFPFHRAAKKGHLKLMELLLYTDLNINKGDVRETSGLGHTGNTPFIESCQEGHTDIVKLMVTSSKDFGIDLNASNVNGWTGLMFACQRGHTEIVKLMIENRTKYGINIQQENDSGLNAFKIVNETNYDIFTLQKLYGILEEAYSADNEPQPTLKLAFLAQV